MGKIEGKLNFRPERKSLEENEIRSTRCRARVRKVGGKNLNHEKIMKIKELVEVK